MIEKLIEKIAEKNCPVVVGLDPMLNYIPDFIRNAAYEKHGKTLEGAAEAVLEYNKKILDATADLIPAIKPQIAMYEQFGIPGLKAYIETVKMAHEKGLIVIGDIKRGDIGSTSAAYATAHIGKMKIEDVETPVFDEDIVTVNPYLGIDGVKPFVDVCKANDRGIFVLVKTSNPSSVDFQDKVIVSDGGNRRLFEEVALKVEEWGAEVRHGNYSDVGAVTGATWPKAGEELRALMPHTFFLVPGYGAQGGKGEDLAGFFDKDGAGAIVNSSRGIICAYKSEAYAKYGAENFADASRQAVLDMKEDLVSHIGK